MEMPACEQYLVYIARSFAAGTSVNCASNIFKIKSKQQLYEFKCKFSKSAGGSKIVTFHFDSIMIHMIMSTLKLANE